MEGVHEMLLEEWAVVFDSLEVNIEVWMNRVSTVCVTAKFAYCASILSWKNITNFQKQMFLDALL